MKIFKRFIVLMTTFALMSFALTGCGGVNSATDANETSENEATQNDTDNNDNGSVADDVGDAAEDVGDAVGDVAQDAGDAVDDLLDGTNGFDNYNDAHDYLLQQMGMNNAQAKYEVRNENQDLTTYQKNNQGYSFELYDTANNTKGERVGQFYVDAKNGKIYQKNEETNKIEEYKMDNNAENGSDNNAEDASDTGNEGTTNTAR